MFWRRERKRHRPQAISGFTLLEMLVALALMSMVLLGLGSVLMTVSQTQSRSAERFSRIDFERTSVIFLRSVLGQVSALRKPAGTQLSAGDSQFFFEGKPQSVSWLGVMPARWGHGGATYFRLSLQPEQKGLALVLEYGLWRGSVPESKDMQRYIVESNVQNVVLTYLHEANGRHEWTGDWRVENELPAAIEIQVQTLLGDWPKTTVAVHSPLINHPRLRGGAALGGHS